LNWWGGAAIEDVICDKNDEPQRGRIEYKGPSEEPLPFEWPLNAILTDTVWSGVIHVPRTATVLPAATLRIMPNTRILFAKDSGLTVNGAVEAVGEKDSRIVFTSKEKSAETYWDEMVFEQARGIFLNCDFERAAMALHSHFSNLKIQGCNFKSNTVGIAFRGPSRSLSPCSGNAIGIKPFSAMRLLPERHHENERAVREEKSGD
jgi:hypothetical protein